MKKYTIKKGQHAAKPCFLRLKRKAERIRWRVSFQQPKYALGDADQMDWNKLFGISFHLFTNHRNSWMLGWRWNEQERVIEVNEYMHRNSKTEYSTTLFTCEAGQQIECYLRLFRHAGTTILKAVLTVDKGEAFEVVRHYNTRARWTREINTWFGGNRTAPRDIELYKETSYA